MGRAVEPPGLPFRRIHRQGSVEVRLRRRLERVGGVAGRSLSDGDRLR